MNNENIKIYLKSNIDLKYKAFHQKLIPTTITNFMGVRVPVIKSLAKEIAKCDYKEYLANVSFDTYEESMLCGLVIGNIKAQIDEVEVYIKEFVPHIDNWAVCDNFCAGLKIANKYKIEMLELIKSYLKSENEFELRFALVMLMDYYIIDDYIELVLSVYNATKHNGYYVKMAVAWGISVCYVKFTDKTFALLENNYLDDFTYNKALQKIVESNRVSNNDKAKIRLMRRGKTNKT